MATVAARRPAAAEFVNFGDLSSYGASFLLPEGNYACFFDVRVHAYTKNDGTQGQPMLGVMMTAYPLAGGDAHEQFYSLGRKSILSYAPDAETGKKLAPIPGAPAGSLAGLTNFNVFLKSLYDCGLPPGVFTNDVSVIDGTWMHTQNVPEPESRKAMGAATGEVAAQQKGPQLIAVCTEILDDGKPWEGGGGMPAAVEEAPAKPKAAVKPAAVAKPAPVAVKKAAPKAPAPVAEVEAEGPDEEVLNAALAGATNIFTKPANAKGMLRLGFHTQLFAEVNKVDADQAQAVVATFLQNDDNLGLLLGQCGYRLEGSRIVAL